MRLSLTMTLLTVAALLVACAPGAPDGPVAWRGLAVQVPDGWTVGENEERVLSLGNAPLGQEDSADELEAAIFFTFEPSTTADDWRELIAQRAGRIDEDETIEFADTEATRLVFTMVSGAGEVREMVVVASSLNVVVLLQPVPLAGQTDGVEMFERHRDTFEAVLASVRRTGSRGVEAVAAR